MTVSLRAHRRSRHAAYRRKDECAATAVSPLFEVFHFQKYRTREERSWFVLQGSRRRSASEPIADDMKFR